MGFAANYAAEFRSQLSYFHGKIIRFLKNCVNLFNEMFDNSIIFHLDAMSKYHVDFSKLTLIEDTQF